MSTPVTPRRSASWRSLLALPAVTATTLLLPALTPAAVAAEPVQGGTQSVEGLCEKSVDPGIDEGRPAVLDAGDSKGYANAATLTARAATKTFFSWTQERPWEACGTDAYYDQLLTVAPGTSGLAVGTPVTLRATVDFAGRIDSTIHLTEESGTGGTLHAESVIDDLDAPCTDTGEGGCWTPPVVEYVVHGEREKYSGTPWGSDLDGYIYREHDFSWSVDRGSVDGPSEYYESVDGNTCESFPCRDTSPVVVDDGLVLDPGTRVITFVTKIGNTLRARGEVESFVRMYNATSSAVSESDGITTALTGVPGTDSAGVQLLLGDVPLDETPADTTAPAVTATTSAPANAAGWNDEVVTVSLAATDEGSGVDTVTYAVSGGEPVTTPGDAAQLTLSDGVHEVTYQAADAEGNTSEPQTLTVKVDTAAPTLTVPAAPLTATAGPAGTAAVSYAATATDALDSAPAVACDPASGSAFPVGTTAVTCTATDQAGNVATGAFDVVIAAAPVTATPAQQVAALTADVRALKLHSGTASPLLAKLDQARKAIAKGQTAEACGAVGRFTATLTEKTGGKGLTAAQAAVLREDAATLSATLGC